MEKQVKISKIQLTVGDNDIELTLEQAKELREALSFQSSLLDDMLAKEMVKKFDRLRAAFEDFGKIS